MSTTYNSTGPVAPRDGDLWINSDNGRMQVYSGTAWRMVDPAPALALSPSGPVNLTVQSATALTVALAGTNYALQVNTNTASSATGIGITAAAAGSGIAITALSSGVNENLTLNAKGTGTVTINGTATGGITLGQATTITAGGLTVSAGGATITGAVTVTGNVLFGTDATYTLGSTTAAPKAIYAKETTNPFLALISGANTAYVEIVSGNLRLTAPTGQQVLANGLLNTTASATGGAGFRLPHGAAPTTPVNGDMWTTTTGLFVYINGVTKTVTLT